MILPKNPFLYIKPQCDPRTLLLYNNLPIVWHYGREYIYFVAVHMNVPKCQDQKGTEDNFPSGQVDSSPDYYILGQFFMEIMTSLSHSKFNALS